MYQIVMKVLYATGVRSLKPLFIYYFKVLLIHPLQGNNGSPKNIAIKYSLFVKYRE